MSPKVTPQDMVIGKHYIGYVGPRNGWVYMGEYLGHIEGDTNVTRWRGTNVPKIHLNGRDVEECEPHETIERLRDMLKVYVVCDEFGCGELATCFGEDADDKMVCRRCDDHCGHNDRGWCLPIERLFIEMRDRLCEAENSVLEKHGKIVDLFADHNVQRKEIERLRGELSDEVGRRADALGELKYAEEQLVELRAEIESRRLRARDAVERLRETFRLRTNCNRVDDAAADACNEMLATKMRVAEEVARRVTTERDNKCVGNNCEETPMFCTEHAGAAVAIANEEIDPE